jgi:GxxExxY protein
MITQIQPDELTAKIIGCCFAVHRELGPGFPERVYDRALRTALKAKGVAHTAGASFRVSFQGTPVGTFQVDLLVGQRVVVEVKAVTGPLPRIFEAQLRAYLKAAHIPVGLLVNFGSTSCQVRRFAHSR